MRAWVIESFGGPETFHRAELPRPEPGPGEVSIRVAATSVNPVDCKVRRGEIPGLSPAFPAVLHGDVAGTVEAVGAGVEGLEPGDEVYGCVGGYGPTPGVLAELAVADARLIARKPRSLPLADAAALPLVALTAAEGYWKAPVGAGDRVLVHGGTGGVGHLALQLAKARGATVTATCGSPVKLEIAASLGADHTVNHREEEPESYVGRLTGGKGFDVVFDTVGGEVLERSLSAAKLNGTVVTVLARGTHDLAAAHARAVSLAVVFMLIPILHGVERERHGAVLAEIADLVDAGRLRPLIDERRFGFDDIGEAHRHLESGRAVGKVLVVR